MSSEAKIPCAFDSPRPDLVVTYTCIDGGCGDVAFHLEYDPKLGTWGSPNGEEGAPYVGWSEEEKNYVLIDQDFDPSINPVGSFQCSPFSAKIGSVGPDASGCTYSVTIEALYA